MKRARANPDEAAEEEGAEAPDTPRLLRLAPPIPFRPSARASARASFTAAVGGPALRGQRLFGEIQVKHRQAFDLVAGARLTASPLAGAAGRSRGRGSPGRRR